MAIPSEAERAFRAYRDTRFFASLDGLRCICIFLVLWHHSPAYFPDTAPLRLLTRGFTGVDFFFVLSGFLITTLLLREEEERGRFSLRGFYRRRVLRIVPVYFLVVSIAAIWFVVLRGQGELAGLVPYYYLFLANFLEGDIPLLAPTWSLAVEEQYYLIWPLVLLLLPARTWLRAGVILAVLAWGLLIAQGVVPLPLLAVTEVAVITLPVPVYQAILLGSLAALALSRPAGFALLRRGLGHRATPLVLLAVLVALWQWLPPNLQGWPGLVMHLTMTAILVSLVIRPDHVLRPVLTAAPFARIGAISYGIYLWHLFGRHAGVETVWAIGYDGPGERWLMTLIYVLASIAIAEASFRFFESRFLRLKTPKAQRPRPVTTRIEGPSGGQAG